jgi:hypothetical protein
MIGRVAASVELDLDLVMVEALSALESLTCKLYLVHQELFVFGIMAHSISFPDARE